MEQSQFTPIPSQPDPEAFRRVWARVMDGRTESPIQLSPSNSPQPAALPTTAAPPEPTVTEPAPAQAPPPSGQITQAPPPEPLEVKAVLASLLEQAQAARPNLQMLLRRGGGRFRTLRELAAAHRSTLARLEAAYFLETGQRYSPPPLPPASPLPFEAALRKQYLWEAEWASACLAASNALQQPELTQLCQELAQAAVLRGQAIRRLVERIWNSGA